MIDFGPYPTPESLAQIRRNAEIARAAYLKQLFKRLAARFSVEKGASAAPTAVRLSGAKA